MHPSDSNPVLPASAHDARPTSGTADTWYVEQGGARKGPMSADQVREMIRSGALTRESLVWRRGDTDWQPLANTPFASELAHEPPPLSGAAVPNGVVWGLAFAPVLGELLAGFLAGLSQRSLDSFWWVTLALNIVLSLIDERRLRAAGHDTKKMGAAWLVPVYLYKRATVLKQNRAYFIVWCVCFALLFVLEG